MSTKLPTVNPAEGQSSAAAVNSTCMVFSVPGDTFGMVSVHVPQLPFTCAVYEDWKLPTTRVSTPAPVDVNASDTVDTCVMGTDRLAYALLEKPQGTTIGGVLGTARCTTGWGKVRAVAVGTNTRHIIKATTNVFRRIGLLPSTRIRIRPICTHYTPDLPQIN